MLMSLIPEKQTDMTKASETGSQDPLQMLCLNPNNSALQDVCQGTWKAAECRNTHDLLGIFPV